MNARSLFLIAALLALVSAGVFQARVILRQREALHALQKRTADAQRQAASLRRECDTARHDLNAAEQQLAALPPRTFLDAATATRQAETNAWLARVKKLKQLFVERPDQRIPEMQWLTDEDWLRVAKRASFEDEHGTRKALGGLRDVAKGKFISRLSPALRAFAGTADGEPPASSLALASHFSGPIDAGVLQRYEIIKGSVSGDIGQGVLTVREKTPIDADYDSRWHASSNGLNYSHGSAGAPYAWIPGFRERSARAHRAYTEANNGARASTTAHAIPFYNPPLDPAKIELILRFERDRPR